jgi:hypothetical protein
MSQTPFSDLLAAHHSAPTGESLKRVVNAFLSTQLGIIASFPDGMSSTGAPTNVDLTKLSDGRTMLLAFADPEAWPDKKLVFVTGRVALDIVKALPDCKGVAVNCATRAVTLVLTPEMVALVSSAAGSIS